MSDPTCPDIVQSPAETTDKAPSDNASIADLVRQITNKETSAADLPTELRQECVDHLTLEGHSSAEIAKSMGIGERTVRRERAAVRREQALRPDLSLGDELLGELQRLTLAGVQRLSRLARESATPPQVRVRSEEAILRSYERFMETANRLNYIETGKYRLQYLRETDPDLARRVKEQRKAMAKAY